MKSSIVRSRFAGHLRQKSTEFQSEKIGGPVLVLIWSQQLSDLHDRYVLHVYNGEESSDTGYNNSQILDPEEYYILRKLDLGLYVMKR